MLCIRSSFLFILMSGILQCGVAPHSSTLAWKIPWMEEPGRLQSMGSPRVGYDWVTSLSLFTFMHWRRKWQPTPVFLPENPRDGGAWWAAVYGVAQSRTRLKWLSSSSSILQCECTTIYFPTEEHSLFERQLGWFWLLWIKLLWTIVYRFCVDINYYEFFRINA